MRRKEFIDIIINSISDKFDIYHNYWFKDKKFVIYAYCYNHNNRFETSGDEAKLWDTRCFEHLFFINCDNLDMESLESLKDFAINSIEPHFVRGDGKSPVKHHLYSHISFIIITRNKPSSEPFANGQNPRYIHPHTVLRLQVQLLRLLFAGRVRQAHAQVPGRAGRAHT